MLNKKVYKKKKQMIITNFVTAPNGPNAICIILLDDDVFPLFFADTTNALHIVII